MVKMSAFSKNDIAHLLQHAQLKARISGLRVLIAPLSTHTGRLLVITPRACGNAVLRNKIRRRLRAVFHQEKLLLHHKDCVVIVKKEGVQTSFEHLRKLLLQAFSQD